MAVSESSGDPFTSLNSLLLNDAREGGLGIRLPSISFIKSCSMLVPAVSIMLSWEMTRREQHGRR